MIKSPTLISALKAIKRIVENRPGDAFINVKIIADEALKAAEEE